MQEEIMQRTTDYMLLEARPEMPELEVLPGWGAPALDWIEAVVEAASTEKLTGEQLVAAIEKQAARLPAVLQQMDFGALVDVLEAAMGAATIWGASQALAKTPALATLAATLPGGIVVAPLQEAVAKLGERSVVARKLTSFEWSKVPLALRERAQFSARVGSARFLQAVQDKINLRLKLEKERLANGKEAFVDRSSFIADMRALAQEENLDTTTDGRALQRGTVRDIRSAKRLGLIFDQQTQQATEFARWKMDQDPDVLDAYPAQRFVRIEDRDRPRQDWFERWGAAGEEVGWAGALQGQMAALKTSPIWARLSAFGVPWPPFDFGSGMGLEDLARDEAEALGLVQPAEAVPTFERGADPQGLNDRLEASVAELSEDMRGWLTRSLGDSVEIAGDTMRWAGEKA
jgi:hypothetical protein